MINFFLLLVSNIFQVGHQANGENIYWQHISFVFPTFALEIQPPPLHLILAYGLNKLCGRTVMEILSTLGFAWKWTTFQLH